MDSISRRERWERAAAEALRRQASREAALAGRSGLPGVGDLCTPPGRPTSPIAWALIQAHPDDDGLLYAVAADDHPLAGVADVVAPEGSECAPLVLRCGLGLWVRDVDLEGYRRVGLLDPGTLLAARRKLAMLARGRIEATPREREDEDDPGYQEWIESVEEALAEFANRQEGDGEVFRLSDFRPGKPGSPGEPRDEALVAMPGGLLGEVAALVSRSLEGGPSYLLIPDVGPGDLYLSAGEAGIGAVWVGDRDEPPRLRARGPGGRMSSARWRALDSRGRETIAPFAWVGDRVELRIGPGEGRALTVRR